MVSLMCYGVGHDRQVEEGMSEKRIILRVLIDRFMSSTTSVQKREQPRHVLFWNDLLKLNPVLHIFLFHHVIIVVVNLVGARCLAVATKGTAR